MADDLEEQEQLATFKAWWAKYGNLVLTAATVVLLAFAAWNGWKWYERREAAAASAIYAELGSALETNNAAKVKELAGSLIQSHGRTVHAAMAGKTGMLVGRWHGSFIHLPLELVIHGRRKVDPTQELWHSVLECTGQPVVMR